jgi:DNA polymerase-3 subunit alpha/error-prone DNA polymerase
MWGTASVAEICQKAKQLGYRHLALTDTDNLCGLITFMAACKTEGLTPIVGAEITDPIKNERAICLVKSRAGYSNLCKFITKRHQDKTFNLKTFLPDYAKGMVVLTNSADHLKEWYEKGVDVAAALHRKPLPMTHKLCRQARKLNVALVATPGSFFLNAEDARIHKMLRAISKNTCLSRLTAKDVAPDHAFLASSDEYEQRFAICPEAIENTYLIKNKLEFTGPDFGIVMPPLENSVKDTERLLSEKVYQGAVGRYGNDLPENVATRIEYELKIINKMNFPSYFLTVQDIIKKSPRICGRGSGAASIVAYCLGITNVCPVKFNLYFERFLNPGRSDPPDIDIDFAWDERDDVLNSVFEKFKDHTAMVSSHVLFQPRMAVREVAKVFGLGDSEIGQVSKRLPWFWKTEQMEPALLDEIKQRPEFKFMDFSDPWPEIMQYAQKLISNPRYLSVHPGGIVITPDPIDTYVPIETATKGVPIMQWDKDAAEDAGLVKIDLLGNRSLGVIRDAVNNVHDNGIEFNESDIDPEDDFDTQQAVANGQTMGCFYIESPAMRLLQKKSNVGDFEHLIIHSSIIRPAANEFIKEYLNRLHGETWDPIHPLLDDVLNETFGIMVYQEDVSKVAVRLAGFNHVEADGLRKILSKKNRALQLNDYYHRFHKGAKNKGVNDKQIKLIWDMILSFSGYSFCKPHSASYARVSFQAAYLKTHFPAEFISAVISNHGGFYSTFAYVSEARRMGLTIVKPDINSSSITWFGKNDKIQVGLSSIKGLSANIQKNIIVERTKVEFKDVIDFFNRIRPADDEARALIHSGALDSFNQNKSRANLLWLLACWQKQKNAQPKKASQIASHIINQVAEDITLFEDSPTHIRHPNFPKEDRLDRLRREFYVLGFLCDCHPIILYEKVLNKINCVKADNIFNCVGKNIQFAGWLITGKTVHTKHGDPMKFLTFEDETGIVETVFFPKIYAIFCSKIEYGKPYLLTGMVESEWGAVTITVNRAAPLSL